MFEFEITAKAGKTAARCGVFRTPHGDFETPVFMPCGTKGAVKTLTPDELKEIGCEIILGNTYHLALRPGESLIAEMGGLQKWSAWNGPILTDSGGFQVFSLGKIRKITDEGVSFQSHIDGSQFFISPERSIEIQEKLGGDIIMAFDECPPGDADYATVKAATERTHRWAERSLKAKKRQDQTLFPIAQGGIFEDLRIASTTFIAQLPSPGIAIGGLSVGEKKEDMLKMLDAIAPHLPPQKPHYLMGVGEPSDLVEGVARGIDMFDCVLPTRIARHGAFWNETGRRNITNEEFQKDPQPLLPGCRCYACQNFSRSYLRHLMIEKEMLAFRLLTIHNLTFLIDLMRKIRASIRDKTFAEFRASFLSKWSSSNDKTQKI